MKLNEIFYIIGFVDGEGSFNISFRKREDYNMPWKISLCFNVSQKETTILLLIKKYLKCGTLRERKNDGVWYYEVNNFTSIINNVIPFFLKYQFLSRKKKNDFKVFTDIAYLVKNKEHLTSEGIKKILLLRNKMNNGGKRKYSDIEITDKLKNPQRLHAKL